MLFFGGYGVQVGRESYMIPVDAAIWKEADVRRDGISIEQVLEVMKEQGARAKLVVVDASRRNPYERRFRTFSHGLAPINAPDNALILTSATPGKVADDSSGQYSVLMTELLNNLNAQAAGVETVFNKTRVAISRASDGEQVPSVSSSLLGRRPLRRQRKRRRVSRPRPLPPHRETPHSGARASAGETTAPLRIVAPRYLATPGSPRSRRESARKLLRIRARRHRPHRIALAQQRAGARHHDVAFGQAVADFDLAAGHQPDLDPPGLDPLPPHHLNHGAGGAIENGGERHRHAAALPGLDQRPAGRIHQQAPVGGHRDEHLAELAVGLDRRRHPAHLAVDLAGADDLDPRGLVDRELRNIAWVGTSPTRSNSLRAMMENSASPLPEAGAPITAEEVEISPATGACTCATPPSGRVSRASVWPAVTVSPASARISATFRPGRSGRTAVSSRGITNAGNLDDGVEAGFRRLEHGDRGALGGVGLVGGEGGVGGEAEQGGDDGGEPFSRKAARGERIHRHSCPVFRAIDIRRGQGGRAGRGPKNPTVFSIKVERQGEKKV